MLVSQANRGELAQDLNNLLVQARKPSAPNTLRVPLNRRAIIACEPHLRELISALLRPSPAPARGIAMVSWLLSDGTGPLFNPRRSAELVNALTDAHTQLDPEVCPEFSA